MLKCTFGQECENAEGYDEKHAEIVCGQVKTVIHAENTSNRNVTVKSLCIDNHFDYEQICKLLDITPKTLLKIFANRKTKMDKIWDCIFDIKKFPCFCMSIYILNGDCKPGNPNSGFKTIEKFYAGHHVFLFLPLEGRITESYDNYVANIIQGEQTATINFLYKNAKALINYREIINCPSAYDFLTELLAVVETKPKINCMMSIQYQQESSLFKKVHTKCQEISEYIAINNKELLLKVLIIKNVLHGIRRYFPTETQDKINEIDPLRNADKDIIPELIKLKKFLSESLPPLNVNKIYSLLLHFCNHFLQELYTSRNRFIPSDYLSNERLMQTYSELLTTPFVKVMGCWILEMNEKNAKEVRRLSSKKIVCIILNEITMNYVQKIYTEPQLYDYYFILSHENKSKNFVEPMLQISENKLYSIGICNYKHFAIEMTGVEENNLFYESCDCTSNTKDKKVWMCRICKSFLYNITNSIDWLKCECGIYEKGELQKNCFECLTPLANNDGINEIDYYDVSAINNISKDETTDSNINVIENKNILFVGKTGAGKSTLINSIANYIKYDFDQGCKNFMECCMPISFDLQTPNFENIRIKAGPKNENENFNEGGQSVTQKPQSYMISAGNDEMFNIIDTPGLGDSRGAEQDLLNIEYIRKAIFEVGKIDAICFVIPSNISKLTADFEMIMRDLLSLFPKTALKNVFFFFTYANSTFFSIGKTRKPLEEFIAKFKASNNAEIIFGAENVFCVDSEAFMYRLATEQGFKYQYQDEKSFQTSWNKSREAINKFVIKLKTVEPIKVAHIQMNYELEKCVYDFSNISILNPDLKNVQTLMAQKLYETSMSSNTNADRQVLNENELKESVKAAAEFCKNLKGNEILKQKIEKLLQHYYGNTYYSIHTASPMNTELKHELREICKHLTLFQSQNNEPFSTDTNCGIAALKVYTASYDDKVPTNLKASLITLMNFFKERNNFQLEDKIVKILLLISEN